MKSNASLCFCVITTLVLFVSPEIAKGVPEDLSSTSSSNSSIASSIETLGPWNQILEDWVVSDMKNARASRVMKLGDKTVTVWSKGQMPNKREVSETDLYLLGAIEKLVYRVDFLENRLRRAEELLYYVISGNMSGKDPCPANYTKIGQKCYHFSDRVFDWKSSASLCRGLAGHLAEFESEKEKHDVMATLQSGTKVKGKHFWTGGLNPGLLWIWASSAKPVYQDTKQTDPGDGRCLKLSYNATSKSYSYRGDECSARHKYICKLTEDEESINKIERTMRMLVNKRSNG